MDSPEELKESKPDPISDYQRLIIDLALCKVKPKTKKERQLLREIKEMETNGYMLDLPWEY